jgi:hypothetical protein
MDIYVFSDNKNVSKVFARLKKGHCISYYPLADLKKRLAAGGGGLVYIDAWGQTETSVRKLIQFVEKVDGYNFGVIDAKGSIKDPASLFFCGASDYLGRDLCSTGIDTRRLQGACEFRGAEIASFIEKEKNGARAYLLSGDSWDGIKSGNEYTFLFMFIELDNKAEIRKMSQDYASTILKQYHDYISGMVDQVNGRVWMWMDFGGLVLFPFNGRECPSVTTAFKLMLDNRIVSSEIFNLDIELSCRIALHVGNTVYKSRGNTGTIVSDSINSIFHLGQKFAPQGSLCLTREVYQYIPKGLGRWFIPAGEYEGREILKMVPLK